MNQNDDGRRAFLTLALIASGAVVLMAKPGILPTERKAPAGDGYSVQDIIQTIEKQIPGAPFPGTVDTLKSGSRSMKVSGIVATMFPTVGVILRTAALHANFIIAHEPTFFNHSDDVHFVDNNTIVRKKQELLDEHQIAVWRFHDGCHAFAPDGIMLGVLLKTGWLAQFDSTNEVIQIPATSLAKVVAHLKTSAGIDHLPIIGDPGKVCRRICLIPGAAPGQLQMEMAEKQKPDVLIVDEVREWETAEYIRDGRRLGADSALVVLGHAASEEPEMEWLTTWLKPQFAGLSITQLSSGSPFSWG